MNVTGIYKIESLCKPERVYIGSALRINSRWNLHLASLRANKHHSKKLQRHYLKYGEEDLVFTILSGCLKEELLSQEQFFIDLLNPYFNVCKIAGSSLGVKRTDEFKQKCKIRKTGSKCYWEGKKRGPQSKKANKKRGESLKKAWLLRERKELSLEEKQRRREVSIKNGSRPPSRLGVKDSEATLLRKKEAQRLRRSKEVA